MLSAVYEISINLVSWLPRVFNILIKRRRGLIYKIIRSQSDNRLIKIYPSSDLTQIKVTNLND